MRMMKINVGIALISFLLCGLLFIGSVTYLVKNYINHDLDFFMKEMVDNLEKRIEYMEDTVNEVRSSQILMDYLNKNQEEEKEQSQKEFRKVADINDSPNQGEEGEPIVSKIYLLRNENEYIQDSYYALVGNEESENERIVKNVWRVYQEGYAENIGFNAYYYKGGETLFLVCPVLNKDMVAKGSLVFCIQAETLSQMMDQVQVYEQAFWEIYQKGGKTIAASKERQKFLKKQQIQLAEKEPVIDMIDGKKYRIYTKELSMGLYVTVGIPETHTSRLLFDSVDIYVIGIVAVLLAGIISFGIFTFRVTKPIEEIKDKINLVEKGDFKAKLPDYDSQEFSEISRGFNQMTKEINHLINEVYEKQIAVQDMKLKFLQTQMNPHFMFNVLNAFSLQAKIEGNGELSEKIATFSQLIQAKIYRSETEKVKIKQELEYVRYYLEIQKFRYGEGLIYTLDVDDTLKEYYVPKLCIQLVVENAVVHGLEPKVGKGEINVFVERSNKGIQIQVVDDGVGFKTNGEIVLPLEKRPANNQHNHVGLNNADSIIKMMYGSEYGIKIHSFQGKGTEVLIEIPLDIGEKK